MALLHKKAMAIVVAFFNSFIAKKVLVAMLSLSFMVGVVVVVV
jgi:hypothetical protein